MLKLFKKLIIMSKKTKEILFWLVMLTAFVTFICSFPSCTSTKRVVEQAKYTTQTNVAEESVEVNGKEDVAIYGSGNDTSVLVTLTPRIDVPFSSPSDIYKGISSDSYKVKEVKIKTTATKQAITTTTNQTQKIQTKKSADLTSATTTKTTKQNNRNILPLLLFAFCSCCCCLFYLNKKR